MEMHGSRRNVKKKRGPYLKRKYCDESEENTEVLQIPDFENLDGFLQCEDRSTTAKTHVHPASNQPALTVTFPPNATISADQATNSHWADEDENLQTTTDLDVVDTDKSTASTAIQETVDSEKDDDLYEVIDHILNENIDDFDEDEDDFEDRDSIVDNDENLNDDLDDNIPLYPGATVTLGAVMLLIALFTAKHGIVGEGVQQLLNIISFCLPNSHRLCASLYSFKLFFRNLKNPLVYHYYCSNCFVSLKDKSINVCPNKVCNEQTERFHKSYFLEVPVEEQIRNLFLQNNFYTSLQHRFEDSKVGYHTYRDVYDGSLYQSYMVNSGPLNSPENISFFLNTDGAAVFKSSKVAIWPIFLVINELPYKLRMKPENMILAGLWFGSKKPAFGTFLQPLRNTMEKFEKGIEFMSPERGKFLCKGFLLACTADLPARCLLCNGVQFNGSFSCWKCLQKGETAQVGKGHAHIFPYDEESPNGPQRTAESVMKDAKNVVQRQTNNEKNVTVNGVKGPSWLMFFPKFDIVSGIAIDYMHGILLGVQKLMFRLWFSKELSSKKFSIYRNLHNVDERLQQIKPTLNITRLPRSIERDQKYWKASEYRSFLLYYGAAVLYGILDDQYFQHYLLLVNAIHILLTCGSKIADVNQAERMLFQFCKHFDKLYDKCFMTLNVHQLVHLADCVRTFGPLYTSSCFPYEDKNGYILKMIRGTQNIDSQIITGVSFVQKLPELKQKCIVKGTEAERLYNAIDSPNILKRGEKLGDGIYILGSIHKRRLTNDQFDALTTKIGFYPVTDTFLTFNRVDLHGSIIYGKEYGRMIKRDNSTVKFSTDEGMKFGQVSFFITNVDENIPVAYAMIELMHCPNFCDNINILAVQKENKLAVVPLKDIQCLCMYISFPGATKDFVCMFPNTMEYD